MKRLTALLVSLFIMISSAAADGYQFIPYNGYTYDEFGVSVPANVVYYPVRMFQGDVQNKESFGKISDIFLYDGYLFVLTPNSVFILNEQDELVRKIDVFCMPDGTELQLTDARGLFVNQERLIVADPEQRQVLISDWEGRVSGVLRKPSNVIFPQSKEFRPLKVLVDSSGNFYVLTEGIYQGAVTYNRQGEFIEFYGNNRVEMTASLLIKMFWRNFMTEKQIDASARNVPVEYTNFYIDEEDFIYTCTAAVEGSSDEIRKLNAAGVNVLESRVFGDQESIYYKTINQKTSFVDIAVNSDGFIFAADNTKGRIFMYDSDGMQIGIFGGGGIQKGRFQSLSSIDADGQRLYAADNFTGSITVFELTEFGNNVYKASMAYMDGRYQESMQSWETVLQSDANFRQAYVGIGKALYLMGDYRKAIRYFNLGSNRAQMSQAFAELRKATLRRYIGVFITLFLCIGCALFLMRYLYHRRKTKLGGDKR